MITVLIKAATVSAVTVVALAGCATGSAAPSAAQKTTTVDSCGIPLEIGAAPVRAITLEQGATEVMLALGLESSMIGTAYLSDPVAHEWADSYAEVSVLSDLYPTTEQVREQSPDFVYSMRSSAFGADAAGSREELVDLGVPAYLSANDCEDPTLVADSFQFDQLFTEIDDIATIFDVTATGDAIIAEQRKQLADITAGASRLAAAPSAVWLYSTYNGAPIVAGNGGLPQVAGSLVGVENSFADFDTQWGETSWDEIAARNPDVIIVADLTRGRPGDSAADKIDFLTTDAVASEFAAVKNDHLITVPAAGLDPSVRSVGDARALSAKIVAMFGAGE
jgi:iron complex transport system substrate-binding protein